MFKGEKPDVPRFKPINVQEEQQKAISGNIKALPELTELGSNVNAFNQQQLTDMLEKAMPGFSEMMKGGGEVINSMLRGEIPQDVSDAISRGTASKSMRGGFGGSQMASALTSRDLGLTSLSLTQQGLDAASRWMQSGRAAATAPMFDVSSMFISPTFQAQFSQQERDMKFQRQWLANKISAMPSPSMAAFGSTLDFLADTFIPIAAGAAGGGGGMMGGGGQKAPSGGTSGGWGYGGGGSMMQNVPQNQWA